MFYKQILLLILITLSCVPLFGQDPSFINYDTKDGLPSSEVYVVEMDESGLLFFSTDRGVTTFDGYDFKTYTTKDGLADNTNFQIFKDSKNRLWFAGYSGEITIYEDEKFSPYQYNDSLKSIVQYFWIDFIAETDNDSLVLSKHFLTSKSIIKLSKSEKPRTVDIENLKEYENRIHLEDYLIIPFGDTELAFGSKLNNEQNYQISYGKKSEKNWLHIVKDSLFKINSNGEVLEFYKSNEKLTNLYQDQKGNLLVYGKQGLLFFSEGNLNRQPKLYFENIQITDVLQDKESNYWITTLKQGIIFVPSFEIKTLLLPPEISNRFLSIGHLENNILFGGENREVLQCDKNNACQTSYIKSNFNKAIKHITPNDNSLFFSGHEAIEKDGTVSISQSDSYYYFVLNLADGNKIRFGELGFYIIKNNGEKITEFLNSGNPFLEKSTKVIQSRDGTIWYGSLGGLYFIDDAYRHIKPYYAKQNESLGRISDIIEDKNNNLWVSTIGNGLYYCNTSKNKNYKFGKEEGLNSDLINNMLLQNDTTLWIGTNKGVDIINFEIIDNSVRIHNVKSLTTKDGLISNFINDIDYWNNKIYLATNKGINYFSPAIVEKEYGPVPIQIKELIVSDSIFPVQDNLEFDYDENDVFIRFTGLNFRNNKDEDFYKYRLKTNKNKAAWFYTNEKNIRYNDLAPGNYLFEVNAQNNSSEWNPNAASISFTIHPHFSQTLWFKIFGALTILGLFALFYFWQIKRLRLRDEVNRKLENALFRTREAELSALRNQMNPHFVYNALNSIQNFIFKKDFEKANYYLVKFSRLMRSSLNFSRLDLISIKEELSFLNDYIELEKMRFPNKFICKFIVEEELPANSLMIPSLLLQPVLENVVKHAFKDIQYPGELEVHFSQNNLEQLKIRIEDNGPGLVNNSKNKITQDSAHQSLGLEIIKNRINLINESNPTIESSMTFINKSQPDNTGLKVIFLLPIKYN